jgi:hypothetical protein
LRTSFDSSVLQRVSLVCTGKHGNRKKTKFLRKLHHSFEKLREKKLVIFL